MEDNSLELSQVSVESNMTIEDPSKLRRQSLHKLKNQFEVSYAELLKHIQTDTINVSNIITIITKSVEIVEHFTNKNGLEKKDLTLRLVKRTVEEFADKELVSSLIEFVDTVGPSFIDTLIFVSKGKLNVNVKKGWNMTMKLFSKCCK